MNSKQAKMNFKQAKKYGGFTLIELLVVISIIGLLAAVVLTSLNDARARAQDSAKNQEVKQIITALELYFQENKGYPIQSDETSPQTPKCLGYEENETCQIARFGDDKLNDKIKNFLPGLKKNETPVPNNFKGISYACAVDSNGLQNGKCQKYQLIWYLADPNGDCLGNAEKINTRQCIYPPTNSNAY